MEEVLACLGSGSSIRYTLDDEQTPPVGIYSIWSADDDLLANGATIAEAVNRLPVTA